MYISAGQQFAILPQGTRRLLIGTGRPSVDEVPPFASLGLSGETGSRSRQNFTHWATHPACDDTAKHDASLYRDA